MRCLEKVSKYKVIFAVTLVSEDWNQLYYSVSSFFSLYSSFKGRSVIA